MEPNQEKNYHRAKERVAELKKFYNHLASYIFVVLLLAGVNYYGNEWSYPWFLWVVFGWGIGVAFDAVKAFRINPMFDKNWEDRKIKEFMEKEESKDNSGKQQRWE